MERKKILKQINIDTDMFMTSFEKAAKIILEQKEKLEKEGWSNIHFKMEYHNESSELIVLGMRLENDTEYNKRIENEKKKIIAEEKKAAKELKKYQILKNKYENIL